ncbi:SH3 domain-containing protein [Chitinophaga skermanii]|uniref:SH3 domain-containing protein n=1 Tax=Chitinophaga skermanii TaxID=331697 RepID=UPI001313FD67|nr:SH3 domain-containing protein [Chitinophaga skermanii]
MENKKNEVSKSTPPSTLIIKPDVNPKSLLYYVNTQFAQVRSGPGSTYKVIDKIPYKTKVQVISIPNGDWYEVKYTASDKSVKQGFVLRESLAK